MSRRSWRATAAARAAGQGRHRRRAAVALTGEHDAALSPAIDPLTNITVDAPLSRGMTADKVARAYSAGLALDDALLDACAAAFFSTIATAMIDPS